METAVRSRALRQKPPPRLVCVYSRYAFVVARESRSSNILSSSLHLMRSASSQKDMSAVGHRRHLNLRRLPLDQNWRRWQEEGEDMRVCREEKRSLFIPPALFRALLALSSCAGRESENWRVPARPSIRPCGQGRRLRGLCWGRRAISGARSSTWPVRMSPISLPS